MDGSGTTVLANQTGATLIVPARAHTSYLIQRACARAASLPCHSVSGSPATSPKSLGGRGIGIP